MYLIDTNVWLERLLDQARSGEVGRFLDQTPSAALSVSDFAFHSICLAMTRLGQAKTLLRFIEDAFVDNAVSLVHLGPEDMSRLVEAMERFRLDFDDAYQYTVAEKHDLILVSFDGDFDRTDRGRQTPAEACGEV